ncbi:uncharacterized protein LOC134844522 [Symsagittifera roscoffensis]|uniref:uncharacterized protein LOC134844522 n=1 Tax=Symsagittifera roscoffensis TaxID=84072 RepID=UPI00307B8F70
MTLVFQAVSLFLTLITIATWIFFLAQSRLMKKTNFVFYCIALALADVMSALCRLSTYSGLSEVLNGDQNQILAAAMLTCGLFSGNIQALVAVERYYSTQMLVVARHQLNKKELFIRLSAALLPSILTPCGLLAATYPKRIFSVGVDEHFFTINLEPEAVGNYIGLCSVLIAGLIAPGLIIFGCYVKVVANQHKRKLNSKDSMIRDRSQKVTMVCGCSAMIFTLYSVPSGMAALLQMFQPASVVKTAWMTADIFCKAGSLANSVLTWFCTNHLKDALRANMYRSTDMTSGGGSSLATAKTTISLAISPCRKPALVPNGCQKPYLGGPKNQRKLKARHPAPNVRQNGAKRPSLNTSGRLQNSHIKTSSL